MSDEYKSPFFDDNDISSSSYNDSDDLFSTSENQLDLNSFANKSHPEEYAPRRKKKGKHSSHGNTPKKRRFLKTALSIFLVLVITFCLVVGSFLIYVFAFVDDNINENLYDLKLNYTTTIYVKDKNTGEYTEYQRLHGNENRIWVSYDRTKAEAKDADYKGIPQYLAQSFVDIEDQRFFSHDGVDWKRTFLAFANMFVDIYSSNQGGSTITQQLVKNLTQDNKQNAMRKIREIMRAKKIESQVDKDTILECYLNTVSFAHGIGGVEVASNYYFNKSVSQLSLAECASLAAIVKEPERYRPDKYPENNTKRRKIVLDKMYKLGHITKEEHDAAVAEDVKIVASDASINEVQINSYFVDALIDDVVAALVDKYKCEKNYAEQNFYNGGYKIYCTLDTDIQKSIDEVFTNKSYFTTSRKGQTGQASFTIMDYSGHVVGIAGGSGKKTTNRGLNRATMSPRSPGSSIKPIATYSLALDNNVITYSTLFDDQPITLNTGKKWPPNSYRHYGGKLTVAKALEKSANTIPAQLVEKMGMESVYDHLVNDMGITTLKKSTNADLTYSALALGSCYKGITTLESCAAFATFGNKGKYYKPTFFTKVTDQHGETVIDGKPDAKVAMGEDTAVIMNHLLRNVVDGSNGTGRGIRSYISNMPIYAKTGTTNEAQNCWFAGGTPYYVASCWYGYDTPENVAVASSARKIWGSIMAKIHKGKEVKDFETSEYVTCRRYCTASGQIATSNCHSTGIGWYKTSNLKACETHGGTILGEIQTSSSASKTTSSAASSTSSKAASTSSKAAATSSKATSSAPTSSKAAASSSKPVSSQKANSSETKTSSTKHTTSGN